MIEKILIVDDEPFLRKFLHDALKRYHKEVLCAENGQKAIDLLQRESFDLIITDLMMPEKTGKEVLEYAKKNHPSTVVVIATAHGTIESVVSMIKLGAFDYILKPFSIESLDSILLKAEEHIKLLKQNQFLLSEQIKDRCPHIIAESLAMKKILQDIQKIALSNASVFITGESGTGKEVIGAAIHKLSQRANNPFIKVNCAAIPETLVESEFFGHERGAFTGAVQRKIGRFEMADKGTFLLDEVTEIPIMMQAKLLRAIQEMEFERVGGIQSVHVNIRFLATSNRNMQEAIDSKIFREDLFYRLNVVPIHIPPLRERVEDIIPLAEFMLKKFCHENHKPLKKLSTNAKNRLLQYNWPGNVRELANIIERTVVMDFDTVIEEQHLYLNSLFENKPLKEKQNQITYQSLYEIEKKAILETLENNQRNRSKTAQILGISVRTLRNKLYEYGTMFED